MQRPQVPASTGTAVAVAAGLGVVAYGILPRIAVDPHSVLLSVVRGSLTGAVVSMTIGLTARLRTVVVAAGVAAGFGAVALALLGVSLLPTAAAGVLVAGLVAGLLHALLRTGRTTVAAAGSLGLVISAMVVASGVLGGPVGPVDHGERMQTLLSQPRPHQYVFDGEIYLRARDLMRHGWSYYPAITEAVQGTAYVKTDPLASPFNFREPFLFYVWKVLPGDLPVHLLGWFVLFGGAMLVCAYLVGERLAPPGPALMGPILLIPYLSFFTRHSTWFTMMEIWAAGLALASLAALLRGRWVISVALLLVAVATRELMVLLIPGWLLAWWWWHRTQARRALWFPAVLVVGPVVILGAHVAMAPATGGERGGMARWLIGPDLQVLVHTLTFGWVPVIGATLVPFAVTACALLGPLLTRQWRAAVPLTAVVVVPLLFLLDVSNGPYGAYWGAFVMPLCIALAPSIIAVALPRVAPAGTATPEGPRGSSARRPSARRGAG